jgi:Domain of unknown function (DUF1707)/Cell wall-active antibiotics response 4TMS YvqF
VGEDEPRPAVRASDADREVVAGLLRDHAVDGRLTLEELAERVGRAYEASNRDQLDELTRDLSVPERPTPRRRPTSLLLSFIGGHQKHGRWRLGKHLLILTFIGGADLDLRQVEIDAASTTITILSFIGGADLQVPAGVEVDLSGFSAIGGHDEHGLQPPAHPAAPLVRVRAFGFIGGTDVWHVSGETAERGAARGVLES